MDISNEVNNHLTESKDYIELVNKLTLEHTNKLDNLIKEATNIINQPSYSVEVSTLQSYYMAITFELYVLIDKLKNFDIYSSLSKAKESESYNNAYLEEILQPSEKKQTVAELQIKAEIKSKKESLVNIVYTSAFKNMNKKIDAGNVIVDTLKNILRTKNNIDYTSNQTDNLHTYK